MQLSSQGKAGALNNFTVVVVDELGRRVWGAASQLAASLDLHLPMRKAAASYIQGIEDEAGGNVNIIWNGSASPLVNASTIFQLNVTLRGSGEVCSLLADTS